MYTSRSYRKNLAGTKFHCLSWQNSRCETFAPACDVQRAGQCEKDTPGQIKKCVRMKKVPSLFYMKDVRRCAEYRPTCEAFCITSPFPREEAPEEAIRAEPSPGDVRGVANWMAEAFNKTQAEVGPYLAREILSRGGIRSYKRGVEKEEYLEIPLHLRNRRGLPPDEMAAEMGMDEKELFEAIEEAYPKARKKTVRHKHWTEFKEEAYDYILAQQREGTWAGLQGLWR